MRKTIVYIVTTSIEADQERNWLKNVRELRSLLKREIQKYPDMKIIKIDSKEE